MSKSINHTWFFNNPPQDVWDYLSVPELMEQWLMKNDFKPVVGHQFQFKAGAMPNYDFDGNIYCMVMEVVPFEKLAYSWKGGPGDGRINLDSVVTWTMQAKDGGTELQLVHSNFKELEHTMMYTMMNQGWLTNVNKIAGLINEAKK